MELRRQCLRTGLTQGLGLVRGARLVHPEPESLQFADELAFDRYFTVFIHIRHKAFLLLEPPSQNAGPPVHKSLGQRTMQRI